MDNIFFTCVAVCFVAPREQNCGGIIEGVNKKEYQEPWGDRARIAVFEFQKAFLILRNGLCEEPPWSGSVKTQSF